MCIVIATIVEAWSSDALSQWIWGCELGKLPESGAASLAASQGTRMQYLAASAGMAVNQC